MSDDHEHTIEAFKEALGRGWSVIPLKPRGKRALIRWKAYQEKRAGWDVVQSWLGQWPEANVGIVTGEISGLVVLDVDGEEGDISLEKYPALPETPSVRTARGAHYYFRHPGVPLANFAGKLPGLDLRADGGYVVGPGSTHESGHLYLWGITPEETPLADLPSWLLSVATGTDVPTGRLTADTSVPVASSQAWARKALDEEISELRGTSPGGRNDQLLRSTAALAEIVAGGYLEQGEVERELTAAAESIGLERGEIRATIRSGFARGSRKPRHPAEGTAPLRIGRPPVGALYANGHSNGNGNGNGHHKAEQGLESILRDAPLTDAGNAECMAAMFGDRFRFDHLRGRGGQWLMWNGNRWETNSDGAADRAALEVMRARQRAAIDIDDPDRKKKALSWFISSENTQRRRNMLAAAATMVEFTTTIEKYDRDQWLAATPSGTLDFRRGELHPGRQDDLITMQMGAEFDPDARSPRWIQFLQEVFGQDQKLIAFIQRAVGYSLTGDTSEQAMFLCYGAGANGKSVFLETIALLLGDYSANAAFSTFDAEKRSEATNDLAALKGKRLVTVIEADEDRRLAEARVKAVTGQDRITCRFLYCEPFTYTPTYKVWMAVNHRPTIRGTDRGIWRRIRLIPFTQTFEGKADKHLGRKLAAELPGILNWALDGLHAWRTEGLGSAPAIDAATEEYRRESDLVGQWFEDMCASDPRSDTLAADAYESFRTWCRTYGFREPTQTYFGRAMEERGYPKARDRRGQRCYQGFIITGATGREV